MNPRLWLERRRIAAAHRQCDRALIAYEIARARRDRVDPPPPVRTVITAAGIRVLVVDPATDPDGIAHAEEWGPLG